MSELFIGIMCGTSLDGIDAVLVAFDGEGSGRVLKTCCIPIEADVVERVKRLSAGRYINKDPIEELGRLHRALGKRMAAAANAVMASASVSASEVTAVGLAGVTVRHCPESEQMAAAHMGCEEAFCLWIGDPSSVAAETRVDVVADFRSMDLALGGQGAPLVPPFHQVAFASEKAVRAIVNIGGIANVSILRPGHPTVGFDTGPGNTLMDAWCLKHTRNGFDEEGAWAATGSLDLNLLDCLLMDEFFSRPAPKSSGKEKFNLTWLNTVMAASAATTKEISLTTAASVQMTLAHLTAKSIADALRPFNVAEVFVCGGGARNATLMSLLPKYLCAESESPIPVSTTSSLGVDPDFVEAHAFAWLARQRLRGEAANAPEVTGARRKAVLGAVYHR